MRLNEISAVKLSDIDWECMQLQLKNGKGRMDRYTKLADKVLLILDE